MTKLLGCMLLGCVAALAASASWALEVGTVAAVDGSGQIGRGGTWTAAAAGTPVNQGDELRTGRPGRLRVVFQDDSVVVVSDDSHLVIDEQVFDPNRGKARSLIELLRGKVDAVVSEYYRQPGTAYEIKTPTAVAGVRGTDFVVKYNPKDDVTEVIGITGRIQVHSLLARGAPVLVTAGEGTSVARGQLPTQPRRLNDTIFRQRLEGLDFIGSFKSQSLSGAQPLIAGASVPEPDRAANAFGKPALHGAPDEALHEVRGLGTTLNQPPVNVGSLLIRLF